MLILRSLKNPNQYIQIGTALVSIGRSSKNTLVIREKSVSRAHARIQLESGIPVLTDLESTRGTYVNGVQVRHHQLKPGDVISFGSVQWKLEETDSSHSTSKSQELVLSSVSNPRQQYPLTKKAISIGRGSGNQLRLRDKSISREHALIQYENGKLVIWDKNSSSGTFVNNRRIQKAELNPGDLIAFGEDQWRVISTEVSQPISVPEQPSRQVRTGPIHIGGYSLNPDPIYGGALHLAEHDTPDPHDRRTPIYIRPCHFGALVDRKTEVKVASASGPNSPLQFHGPHGAGKTTLLCYLAHHPFAVTFQDGIIHLLARGRGVLDILQNIHEAFFDQAASYVATEAEIRAHLQSKIALILLDDVELSPEDTSELIAAAPKCTFILASTKKCLQKGKHIIELEGFESEDALSLFGKVIGRGLNAEELPLVKTICSALGNNPVRIIQAASYTRGMGQSIGALSGALDVAVPVNGLNSLIVQSLSEVERYVVAVLAALGGGSIHNRHLSSLVGTKNTRGVLEGLMGRGLVRESNNRYSLTGTFVEYLQQEWDLSDWATRIMAHFSSWVERHQAEPEYVLFEIEAILAILTWAVRAGRWQEVLHLSRGVEGILMAGKQWGAWQTVLQSGLQAAQMLGDPAAEAWALHQLGTRAMCLGDKAAAHSALEQAFQIRQSIGDRVGAELTRQNQSLLSASLPVPAKPAASAKMTTMPLRPLLLFGGAVTVLVTLGLIISNWPTPETPPPIRASSTFTSTRSPIPVATTLTPSRTPTTIFSPTNTKTSTPTTTRTSTPTRTRTFTPTNTSTITPPPSFGSPQLSTDEVYYYGSSCGPDSVTIRIFAQHPAGILAMVFFHRLHEIGGSQDSGWSSGLSMKSVGSGTYSLTVSGDTLVSETGFSSSSAQVSYQFVIQPQSGKNSNSPVYTDLYLYPCDYSPGPIDTPTVTEPPIIGFPLPFYTQLPIFVITTSPPPVVR